MVTEDMNKIFTVFPIKLKIELLNILLRLELERLQVGYKNMRLF